VCERFKRRASRYDNEIVITRIVPVRCKTVNDSGGEQHAKRRSREFDSWEAYISFTFKTTRCWKTSATWVESTGTTK